MTQKVDWSIDALRLAGRLRYKTKPIPFERIAKICSFVYEEKKPAEIVGELVDVGYLTFDGECWTRTQMEYTAAMTTQLLAMVQIFRGRKKEQVKELSIVRKDIEPGVAYWFGYPQHPVFATGRIHYLKDDE